MSRLRSVLIQNYSKGAYQRRADIAKKVKFSAEKQGCAAETWCADLGKKFQFEEPIFLKRLNYV